MKLWGVLGGHFQPTDTGRTRTRLDVVWPEVQRSRDAAPTSANAGKQTRLPGGDDSVQTERLGFLVVGVNLPVASPVGQDPQRSFGLLRREGYVAQFLATPSYHLRQGG